MSPLFTQRVTAAGVVALVLLLIGPAIFLHVDGARSLQQGTNHEPKLSSRTDLVQLPVSVTDAHDNFVAGLTIDNFRVLEEGQAQNISFFEEEDTPVTVGLIVDHSGSMGSKPARLLQPCWRSRIRAMPKTKCSSWTSTTP